MDQLLPVLNISVVSICTVMKVPQIYRVVKVGTTDGISFSSLLMEFWCFSILLAYPCAHGYPLSGYMEFMVLVTQDCILILMLLRDRKKLSIVSISALVLFLSFIAAMAMGALPEVVLYTVMSTCTPLSAASKIVQLRSILVNKSAGAVSPATWGIGTCTATTRVFTHALTTADKLMMVTSAQAACLNLAVCVSSVFYRDTKQGKTH